MRKKNFLKRSSVGLIILIVAVSGLFTAFTKKPGKEDPLPSWNETPAKKTIVEFVHKTTDKGSPGFVKPEDRIATFDQDGTLWVEHPLYSQLMYCRDRGGPLVKAKPELKDREPFKTVLSGDREAIAKLSMKELEEILMATLTGMSTEQFQADVK